MIIGSGLAGLSAALKLKNRRLDRHGARSEGTVSAAAFFRTRCPRTAISSANSAANGSARDHERIKALCSDFKIPLQRHQFDEYLQQDGKVSRPGEWGFSPKAKAAFDKMIAGTKSSHRLKR